MILSSRQIKQNSLANKKQKINSSIKTTEISIEAVHLWLEETKVNYLHHNK